MGEIHLSGKGELEKGRSGELEDSGIWNLTFCARRIIAL